MQSTGTNFTVMYIGEPVHIELFQIKKTELYKASFPNGNVLVVTHGKHENGNKFWTSIPEGKQQLAENIGELIDAHFASSVENRSDLPKPPRPPKQTSLF